MNRTYKKIEPERLKRYVKEHPEATQQEMAEEFGCCNQAISKALKRNKITRKKTIHYKEQDPEKVKEYQEKIEDIDPEKIAYVDESGIDECLHREYGYAPSRRKSNGIHTRKEIPKNKYHCCSNGCSDHCTHAIQWNNRCPAV